MVKNNDNVVTWDQVFVIIGVLIVAIIIYLVLCWVDIRIINNHPLRVLLLFLVLCALLGVWIEYGF